MHTVVCENGVLMIPQALLDRMDVGPGDLLDIAHHDGMIVLSKSVDGDPVSAVYGTLKTGRSTDDILEELRGPGPG